MHRVALQCQQRLGKLSPFLTLSHSTNRNQCAENYAPVGSDCSRDRKFKPFEKRAFISGSSIPDLEIYPDGSGAFQNHSIPKIIVDRILDRHAAELAAGPVVAKNKRQSTCPTPDLDIICGWFWDICMLKKYEMTDYDCLVWACATQDGWVG